MRVTFLLRGKGEYRCHASCFYVVPGLYCRIHHSSPTAAVHRTNDATVAVAAAVAAVAFIAWMTSTHTYNEALRG